MSSALRPLTTAEVLDRTFSLYRQNWLLFIGISALPATVLTVGLLLAAVFGFLLPKSAMAELSPVAIALFFGGYGSILGIFYLVGYSFALAATVLAVSHLHLGHPITILDSYKRVGRRGFRVMAVLLAVFAAVCMTVILAYFVVFSAGALIITPLGFQGPVVTMLFGVLLAALFAVCMVWAARVGCRYSLAVQPCMLENLKTRPSLRRSKFLAQGSLFRIFIVYLLMMIVGSAITFAFQAPGMILSSFMNNVLGSVVQIAGSFMGVAFSFPIGAIAMTLLYYDQRVRKEAFDLQVMMESLGQAAPGPLPAASPTTG